MSKRRPLFNLPQAHRNTTNETSTLPAEFWVTSLAALRYTDLLASGSFNGQIRLWKSTPEFHHLSPLFSIEQVCSHKFTRKRNRNISLFEQIGFINDLKFSSDGQYLLAALGQEHRLGRWWTVKSAKNALLIYKLPKTSDTH